LFFSARRLVVGVKDSLTVHPKGATDEKNE
jgi:hypothetical protein